MVSLVEFIDKYKLQSGKEKWSKVNQINKQYTPLSYI